MNILQGLIPSYTTRHAVSAMERLPRKPVVVPAPKVVKVPKVRKHSAPVVERAMQYFRDHPGCTRADAIAALDMSVCSIDVAVRRLKALGELPQGRMHQAAMTSDKVLAALRVHNVGAAEELAKRLGIGYSSMLHHLRKLRERGAIECKKVYVWQVKA